PAWGRGPLTHLAAGRCREPAPAPPFPRHSTPRPRPARGWSHHTGTARSRAGSGLQGERLLLVLPRAAGELHRAGALEGLVDAPPYLFGEVGSGGEQLHGLLLALAQAQLAVGEPAA